MLSKETQKENVSGWERKWGGSVRRWRERKEKTQLYFIRASTSLGLLWIKTSKIIIRNTSKYDYL